MQFIRSSILLLGFCITTGAYAIAPVVDAYDEADSSTASSASTAASPSAAAPTSASQQDSANKHDLNANNKAAFSLGQRLSIQEQQIANLNPLLVQVDDLTQKVQALQGKLEEQQHHLKVLEDHVRLQYQDIDKRLNARAAATVNAAVPVAGVSELKPKPKATCTTSDATQDDASDKAAAVSPSSATSPTAAPSTSVKMPTKAVPGAPTTTGEHAYQEAFQSLKNKQYPLAIQGFESFIKKYPYDVNQPNANYFLGQLYLLEGQPDQSVTRFNHFISTYPQDSRIPDALLQLGLGYFAKGEKSTAMETFKKIIQRYPDSKAAQSAQARLQQFQAMISAANATIVTKHKV